MEQDTISDGTGMGEEQGVKRHENKFVKEKKWPALIDKSTYLLSEMHCATSTCCPQQDSLTGSPSSPQPVLVPPFSAFSDPTPFTS